MGQATMHMAPWSLEDAGRELSQAQREKLQGLDYRIRKGLGRLENDLADADQLRPGQKHVVLFHKEGVPESLDALRVEGARFKLDLTAGSTNRVCVRLTVSEVSLRGNRQRGFRPHPMRGMRMPRAVEAEFWFEVDPDFQIGSNSVSLSLYMAARKCLPCNGSGSWEVPCYAAYAVSDRFLYTACMRKLNARGILAAAWRPILSAGGTARSTLGKMRGNRSMNMLSIQWASMHRTSKMVGPSLIWSNALGYHVLP